MRYLSVCSGIEAATVAWEPLGWTAAAFSEIEPFPSALLAHYYPDVPNLGDMERHREWGLADVDLLVGGTPCQSFSVAGLRKGMADPRGNLALVYLAIADQLRPEWLVWENVPGVLSSNGGRDFGAFLGALGQLGYGWTYRVLDAQYFGVPQRRRRVFVVGCARGWQRAAAVLFERASLRGDSAPSREEGARVAASLTRGAESSGKGGYAGRRQEDDVNIVGTLRANSGRNQIEGPYVAHTLKAEGFDASEDGTGRGVPLVASSLTAREGKGPDSDATTTLIACFDETQITHPENRSLARPDSAALASTARPPSIASDAAVRRLTPRECERLQGFPDDYTLFPYKGKPASDSARYRALGNSMAVPVMRWIGERIKSL